jgi:phage gp29-like protein
MVNAELLTRYPGVPAPDQQAGEASPNTTAPYLELPVYGAPPPDRKWQIDQIINELNVGQFSRAGLLGDSIMRDGRIMGAIEQRNAGLFGAPLEIEAADDSAQAGRVRDEIEENWEYMFPQDALEEMQTYAILQGIAIVEKVWDFSTRPWTFKIQPYHPQYYLWRWDQRAYNLLTLDRSLIVVPQKSTQFISYTPYGYRRAFLRGRLRSLVDPWMMRNWDKNDWAHWCEIHGKPIRKAIVPQLAVPAQEKEFVRAVANLGNNTTVKVRQDKDGNKYDVELLEAMSMGWKGFEAMIAWCDKEISNVLLGQSASTDGQGGLGAQEKPGDSVRCDIKASDSKKLCMTLREQALKDYCLWNYGNADLAPRVKYDVDPAEDQTAVAQMHANQASADKTYVDMGAVTPEEIALSRFGGGTYSLHTDIDAPARQRIARASLQQLEDAVNAPAIEPLDGDTLDGD